MKNKERMMQNELRIIEDMKGLLQHNAGEQLQWKSTKTDLVELTHILYESGEMRDDDDVPVTFKNLLTKVCDVVHVSVPKNPCAYLRQANNCQGLRRAPLLVRYKGLNSLLYS